MAKSKDLFDDTTMSFGEHLEALRVHLWKALLGLAFAVVITLYYGDKLVGVIRAPIDAALQRHGLATDEDTVSALDFWSSFKAYFGGKKKPAADDASNPEGASGNSEAPHPTDDKTIIIKVLPSEFASVLHAYDPQKYPIPQAVADEKPVTLQISAPEFHEFHQTFQDLHRPITLNVQEAFMMYMKVSLVGGLILASPWIYYQLWLFVAAGLYPHERRYVYIYLPLSLGLFLGGVAFCFYVAMPVVLDFFLGFNRTMGLTAQIHMAEWVSFAIMLPLMFGVSFQLPVVMLFLERISIVTVDTYRKNRKLAILAIAIIAAVLTPTPDPGTMLAMLIPLLALYELGILLCSRAAAKDPLRERQPA